MSNKYEYFDIHHFTLMTIEVLNTTIKKGSNIHWSKRKLF